MIRRLAGPRLVQLATLSLIPGMIGCNDSQERRDTQVASTAPISRPENTSPRPVLKLTLLVVEDSDLAIGIKKLRGEWNERTGGGELEVVEWNLAELHAAKSMPADLVVYPSRFLGTLVEKKWVQPLRDSMAGASDFAIADLLPRIRDREMIYGDRMYAAPLGSPPLMLCVNPNLLNSAGCAIPQTWNDYRDVVKKLKSKSISCHLPLAGRAAAIVLIARGVSYVRDGGQAACLFDPDTFQPQIDGPPFVRALQEIVQETSIAASSEQQPKRDQQATAENFPQGRSFQDAVQEVAFGHSAMTFAWPGIYCPTKRPENQDPSTLLWLPLPRATKTYWSLRSQWKTNRIESPVTLLGAAGRLASVSKATRNGVSAFKLLGWLSSGETAMGISAVSRHTQGYRYSQQGETWRWQAKCQGLAGIGSHTLGGSAIDQSGRASKNISTSTEQTLFQLLETNQCFLLPRIPGIDQYLDSLAMAVRKSIAGESAATTLQQAATQWSKISRELGKQQRFAYRAHWDH